MGKLHTIAGSHNRNRMCNHHWSTAHDLERATSGADKHFGINTLSAIVENEEATHTDADVFLFMHKANVLDIERFDEKDNVPNLVNNGEDDPHLACMIVMNGQIEGVSHSLVSPTTPRMKLQMNG